MGKHTAKDPKLVTEKQEGAGTVAKAGVFWAILAALPLLARYAKRRRQKKRRLFRK
jgi:hypothetical protein